MEAGVCPLPWNENVRISWEIRHDSDGLCDMKTGNIWVADCNAPARHVYLARFFEKGAKTGFRAHHFCDRPDHYREGMQLGLQWERLQTEWREGGIVKARVYW